MAPQLPAWPTEAPHPRIWINSTAYLPLEAGHAEIMRLRDEMKAAARNHSDVPAGAVLWVSTFNETLVHNEICVTCRSLFVFPEAVGL